MSGHNHDHNHSHGANRSRLLLVLFLTFGYMIAEFVGGYITDSLALIADAGHMLTDVAALILTLTAFWMSSRPANPRKTYGYYRWEILAAFINGISLILIALFIFYEAVGRIQNPPEIRANLMITISVGGLIVNLVSAYLLHGGHNHDLNMRGAWLHVVSDALGSAAAIVAGVLILAFGWFAADAIVSFIIGAIIIYGAWNLVVESVNILLEGTPRHVDLNALETTISGHAGVLNVHDLHVWSIASGREALSVHVVYDEKSPQIPQLRDLQNNIKQQFGISHSTIQLESATDCDAQNFHACYQQKSVN